MPPCIVVPILLIQSRRLTEVGDGGQVGCRWVEMKRTGIALIAIGVVITLVVLTADLTGISDDPHFQIGPQQMSGILLGLIATVVGVVLLRRDRPS